MAENLAALLVEVANLTCSGPEDLENVRVRFLGKKGVLKGLYEDLKNAEGEEKKSLGKSINDLRIAIESKLESAKVEIEKNRSSETKQEDLTKPSGELPLGARHPISIVRREMLDIFTRIGFTVAEGPEIEDDWHVFSGLNFPEEHPARDMQDTFFVSQDPAMLLRTHTSSVQVREMEKRQPPIRIVMPGRVFRNEAISARAHCMFHQIEGLYIDKDVSFADLKQTLLFFAREFFGAETKIRLRPSYFPFTEPSAEMDVYWGLNSEADYRITKGTGWLEILGCGMVDPAVLSASGIDPNVYTGFAFGMGLERIAMLRYQISDLRLFFENDARFLKQFSGAK